MQNINIQIVTPEQAEEICRYIITTLPEWFGIPEANERYAKGCLLRTSFAAYLDEKNVGMITLEFPFSQNANIYWLAVDKNYHGKLIGTLLLQKAEQYCFEKGYFSLTVETLSPKHQDRSYLKTYQFYENNGFKPLFELQPYGSDYTMVYMQKNL